MIHLTDPLSITLWSTKPNKHCPTPLASDIMKFLSYMLWSFISILALPISIFILLPVYPASP